MNAATPREPGATLLRQLALGCRILSLHGHDDFNQGQFSARLRGGGDFRIKAARRGFDDAAPEDMVTCPVSREGEPPPEAPPETPLHQAIYAARPDVGAVVHSHAEHATVFGATDLDIVPLSHEGSFFQGRVGRFEETSHTILDHDVADAVARALGRNDGLFLCNHGLVVVAPTARQAVVLTLMLERACRLQLLAEAAGRPYRTSRADEVEAKRRYIYSDVALRNYWDHAAQAAVRAFPEAAAWHSRQ
ncbi:class II aldolase/adducin family protein [Arenibaculum sp.]|uniref:class II aldolase/adducin family protein n=1 Tax=Arenibaculum sp. TaxID=2865862 RepID=UPI002E168117|nr:class II aldolase/adducin family protein [Arenibaculum sp.]